MHKKISYLMKTKTLADALPKKDVAAQTIDNAAIRTDNIGTVRMDKGSDESYAIHLNIMALIKNSITKE